ncbi:dnaJ homolog subfamily C member 28-like isoform X2 [Daphnia carinata]|uniref:dnaJ homolog subfamily C member 28-like isoform X2 n=1 Tax=Daphnia carinata TaxID=120202 RepID=UPI00257B4A87|nr:dnaJ homolog subfamily C member 28-like isoform X2 [Daphnia carinata]
MILLKGCKRPLRRLPAINIRKIVTSLSVNQQISHVDYQACYKVLGLHENCSQQELKAAFVGLAKKHHPDSNQEADSAKFQLIENAYRKLQEKFSIEIKKSESVTHKNKNIVNKDTTPEDSEQNLQHDIEHTAPQHRQFLNYEGIGQGTPFQREKQYQKYQVKKAVENVYNHRISQIPNTEENSLVWKDNRTAKKSKIRLGIDRLVEDLIQESMAKGEFTNLKGTGKPLVNQNHNPYVDIVTHKINQVLIENGFSPQWVMLEKDIRSEITNLKFRLEEGRRKLGKMPLTESEKFVWNKLLDELKDDVKQINKKINDYNLIVPLLNKQMVHVNLKKMSEKYLKDFPSLDLTLTEKKVNEECRKVQRSTSTEPGLFDLWNSLWKSN